VCLQSVFVFCAVCRKVEKALSPCPLRNASLCLILYTFVLLVYVAVYSCVCLSDAHSAFCMVCVWSLNSSVLPSLAGALLTAAASQCYSVWLHTRLGPPRPTSNGHSLGSPVFLIYLTVSYLTTSYDPIICSCNRRCKARAHNSGARKVLCLFFRAFFLECVWFCSLSLLLCSRLREKSHTTHSFYSPQAHETDLWMCTASFGRRESTGTRGENRGKPPEIQSSEKAAIEGI
jgi:hypothetical protein